MFALWRRLHRRDLFTSPFPDEYRTLIARNVPLYSQLPAPDRDKLESLIRIFIAEKRFVGVLGLELSEEMCVAIAARACLLILRRVKLDDPVYPDLGSVIVYPNEYRVQVERRDGYVVHEGVEHRLGESWRSGTVVLSWRAAKQGAAIANDGHDVVLHEFAHQLDGQDGAMDGTPELPSRAAYASWAEVFSEEFYRLRAALDAGRHSDIDSYGATNAAEFFAVVTEKFFEQPRQLRQLHPELYVELVDYFLIDPLAPLDV